MAARRHGAAAVAVHSAVPRSPGVALLSRSSNTPQLLRLPSLCSALGLLAADPRPPGAAQPACTHRISTRDSCNSLPAPLEPACSSHRRLMFHAAHGRGAAPGAARPAGLCG